MTTLAVFAAPALAQNNGLPTQRQGLILVEVITQRGLECDLLRPWQAGALRMQTRMELGQYDSEARAEISGEIAERTAAMTCEDPLLIGWIEGASPGFEREMLPFFLVAYDAMAGLDPVPALFAEETGRSDYGLPLSIIGAEIERLQDAGIRPEGGVEWDAYETRINTAAAEIGGVLGGADSERFSHAEAEAYATDIARITELWLADAMTESDNSDTNGTE
ncbi:hypothetical protein [Hyphobacterium marinum]|uniref:Uncharacterized protein n=1 Tax=Hyphobacterium marinum TaxID=3116574 RepID=A0ABU7LVI8_9PROT|nr:hypothetical protein [Hyphobacterium sp. Y6023]MEE2565567.1 hypothetical protein [Hyphobacterium sp. Y6023]